MMIFDKIFFVVVILSFIDVLGLQQEFIRLASIQCNPSVQDCKGGTCYKTLSGCQCKDRWQFGGKQYNGCQNPDNSPEGDWCEFMPGTCESKSHSKFYEHCHTDCETVLLGIPPQNSNEITDVVTDGVSDESCGDLMDNIDYAGNDLSLKAETAQDCQRICGLTIDCKFVSYRKYDKRCWLKPAPINLVYKTNFVSGPACS